MSIRIDGVWDIETSKWDEYVVGGILWKDGRYREFTFDNEEGLVRAIASSRGQVWAHFGGKFDFLWFLDRLPYACPSIKNVQITTAGGGRIISVRIGKDLEICDSYALAPMKLADFTAGMNVEKQTLDLPCVCGKTCGGYCSISRNMSSAHWRVVKEYLRYDCESLMTALQTLNQYATDNELDVGRTIGSSAWKNASRQLGIPSARNLLTMPRYMFARRSYFGGRTQLYRRSYIENGKRLRRLPNGGTESVTDWKVVPVPHGWEMDVNSMYPWALRTFAVPYGYSRMVFGFDARAAFQKPEPGIYKAKVIVPESYIPPLPLRYEDDKRIAYPTGEFVGIWTLPELMHAESVGAEIQPLEALVWDEEVKLFEGWIDKLWKLRASAPGGKKSPIGTWLKLYMNSLTGKFGSSPEKEGFIYKPHSIRICNCKCKNTGLLVRKCDCFPDCKWGPCHCKAHTQISDNIWRYESRSIEDCAHVQFCAYLTAQSRAHLNRAQISDGEGGRSVIYSDTDSIHAERLLKSHLLGSDLGQFGVEHEWVDFIGVAPKVYSYLDAKTGEIIRKAKGITFEKDDKERPQIDYKYHSVGVLGFKTALKAEKLFKRRDNFFRTIRPRPGDRVNISGSAFTRPPTIEEIRRRDKDAGLALAISKTTPWVPMPLSDEDEMDGKEWTVSVRKED